MDRNVVIEYLKWLSMVAGKQYQCLIWDVYPSHRCEAVKTSAAKVKIHLSFVPSGLTATWQPLDCRVFGSLKAPAKERFNAAVLASLHGGEEREWGRSDALVMLSKVWSAIPQEETIAAWSRLG